MKEALNKLIEQARSLAGRMSVSQQMSLAMLALVVVVSLITLAVWSGDARSSDRAILLENIDAEKAEHIRKLFEERGIQGYEYAAGQISVPHGEDSQARAAMAGDPVFQKKNMFQSLYISNVSATAEQRNRMWLDMVRRTIRDMIKGWDGVKDAEVVITPPERNRFVSVKNRGRRASVDVTMEYGQELTQTKVESIARILSGAVSMLDPEAVQITSNGKYYPLGAPDATKEAGLGLRHTLQEAVAKRISDKIRNVLTKSYTETTQIVTVKLDMKRDFRQIMETNRSSMIRSTEDTESKEGVSGKAGTPGVRTNPSPSAIGNGTSSSAAGGGTATKELSEHTEKHWDPKGSGFTKKQYQELTDTIVDGSVSVIIPYEEAILTRDGKKPEKDDEREANLARNIKEVERIVGSAFSASVPTNIFVTAGRFREVEMPVVEQSALSSVGLYAKQYGGTVLLFAFAALALMMIGSMIKKSIPTQVVETVPETGLLDTGAEEEAVVDDEEILQILNAEIPKHQKAEVYKNRIHQAVEEDVQAAAELVKRWLLKEA